MATQIVFLSCLHYCGHSDRLPQLAALLPQLAALDRLLSWLLYCGHSDFLSCLHYCGHPDSLSWLLYCGHSDRLPQLAALLWPLRQTPSAGCFIVATQTDSLSGLLYCGHSDFLSEMLYCGHSDRLPQWAALLLPPRQTPSAGCFIVATWICQHLKTFRTKQIAWHLADNIFKSIF